MKIISGNISLFMLFTSIAVFTSCNSKNLSSSTAENYIIFEDGGGFTGFINTWALYEDGSIFKVEENADTQLYLGKINGKQAKQVFTIVKDMKDSNLVLNEPGNLYKTISYVMNGERTVWSFDPLLMKDHKLNILHNNFKRLLKTVADTK